jgi:bacillopeptidase F
MRLAGTLSIALASVGCAGAVSLPGSLPDSAAVPLLVDDRPARFEGDFEARLRAAPPTSRLVALVDLRDQVDLDALGRRLDAAGVAKRERRTAVVRALEAIAEESQAALRPELDQRVARGEIDYWRGFAIVNRILVEGKPSGILALANLETVAWIRPDWTSERRGRLEATLTPEGAPVPERFTSWGVVATGAPALWAQGIDGTGVVVASIDTGVAGNHEQFAGRMLPAPAGWFDPVEGTTAPRDNHGHGTSVLSVAVGGNAAGKIVGIAPGATWASALGNWKNHYSRSRMTQAADWIFRVVRPDVLVNAWSHDEDGPCQSFDLPFVRAWQAAGTFVVFPAGNAGPGEATGESPAELTGGFPDGGPLVSVAGLAPNGTIHPRSSRGPSRCGADPFPTFAAPGADLPYAYAGDPTGYASGQGTSLAAGVVAGGAALLLQAVPEASPADLALAFRESARDVPPPGDDPAAGAGAIDLPRALARLREIAGER